MGCTTGVVIFNRAMPIVSKFSDCKDTTCFLNDNGKIKKTTNFFKFAVFYYKNKVFMGSFLYS